MHIAQNWRIRHARYALQGVRCEKCGTILFPARAVCPNCETEVRQLPQNEAVPSRESFSIVSDSSAQHLSQAAR